MPESEEAESPEVSPDLSEEETEVQCLREEVQQFQDSLARAQAELANMQKRHERERELASRYRIEPLARELLEIIDAMEEAWEAMEREETISKALREGQELTLRNIIKILNRFSIEVIDPLGENFDPQSHEAVTMRPAEESDPGSILEVLCKGYRLHDRLLRPARVVVAVNPPSEQAGKTVDESDSSGNRLDKSRNGP